MFLFVLHISFLLWRLYFIPIIIPNTNGISQITHTIYFQIFSLASYLINHLKKYQASSVTVCFGVMQTINMNSVVFKDVF